ncbi:HepT-like ribonuclease domain-containing protein [Thermoflexus hugenholtzii]
MAIEACLDIGRRLIAREGFRYPEDNADVFRVLAEHGNRAAGPVAPSHRYGALPQRH